MGHYFKLIGNNFKHLWENREALEMYLARLKELMGADEKEKLSADQETPQSKTDSLNETPDLSS